MSRFISKAKNTRMSLLDTLSGFLKNESESEDEDPHLAKVACHDLVEVGYSSIRRYQPSAKQLRY